MDSTTIILIGLIAVVLIGIFRQKIFSFIKKKPQAKEPEIIKDKNYWLERWRKLNSDVLQGEEVLNKLKKERDEAGRKYYEL